VVMCVKLKGHTIVYHSKGATPCGGAAFLAGDETRPLEVPLDFEGKRLDGISPITCCTCQRPVARKDVCTDPEGSRPGITRETFAVTRRLRKGGTQEKLLRRARRRAETCLPSGTEYVVTLHRSLTSGIHVIGWSQKSSHVPRWGEQIIYRGKVA